MKSNKDKWSFQSGMPSRKPLTTRDIVYLKNIVHSLLKIGMEFEFNLPEKKNGFCVGDDVSCPCKNIKTSDCWKACIHAATCKSVVKDVTHCKNATAVCNDKKCVTCKNFLPQCKNLDCVNFTSFCIMCADFEIDCTNCKFRFDPDKSPKEIRHHLDKVFKPSNNYCQVGDLGVHKITTDGSLLGDHGAEIITTGRRVNYWEYYKMIKGIISEATSKGAYVDERCSIHMHALTSYYSNMHTDNGASTRVDELERSIPEIVVANLHQLVRRYQNAMTWMMMGLGDMDRLTRWEKFRISVLPISAVMHHMKLVKSHVTESADGKKYGWINYNNMEFDKNGDISKFHVEFRACDGLLSPSAVAAIGCMYYALIIKAIEISRYGVVEIGDENELKMSQTIKEALMNNMKAWNAGDRFSDTRNLMKYKEVLVYQSMDLIMQLKNILLRVGPAYEILEKLAERPCALRLADGENWDQIEKNLEVIVTDEDKFEIALTEIMTLQHFVECGSFDEWIEVVGQALRSDPNLEIDPKDDTIETNIKDVIDDMKNDGKIIWSSKIGAPIML